MEAKCVVLLPGEYMTDKNQVVPIHIWSVYEADVVLVVDEDGNTSVIKNRWGDCGKVVPQE